MKEDDVEKKSISRRNFLKTAGGAAAVAGLASSGIPLMVGTAQAACDALPKKWDETYDVVVVGSGFAGLAAAIEAKNAGASVALLEKMPVHGGNSVINGGDFCAPGTKLQKENGVEDSADLLYKDMMRAGMYLNHPELARTVADNAKDALEWTESYLGCRYTKLNFHGGHSVKRAHGTINQSGSEVVNKELAKAKEIGVKIMLRTKLVKFLSDKDGRIVGVEVLKGMNERQARKALALYMKERLEDEVWRAYGTLRYARLLSEKEVLELLSKVRLGIDLKLINEVEAGCFSEILISSRTSYLQNLAENENLSKNEIDRLRAEHVRKALLSYARGQENQK